MTDGSSRNYTLVSIEDELRTSFIDYAMSVIVARALPDARDGLKPVHRRILYTMYRLRNLWNQPYIKSARVVGDTMGKLHPHGDSAIYEALVRMAQDFSLRYPLADGQGNFGSIDGDPAAAMRYTEIRMAKLAGELLADIDKDTVEFIPNYDDKDMEPTVLPTRVPNLLVNGSSGIAVGMATNIPPHNLGEVVRACKALVHNPHMTSRELMEYVPAPDFPTGGIIYGRAGLRSAYETGKGSITIRSKAHIEEISGGRSQIIVTEIPYQVNKAQLLEKIADLVKAKQIEGITDIRDESDRTGMRVVIQVKREAQPEVVLNKLFKQTSLQKTYGINLIAIVDRRPKLLNLRAALVAFLKHRREVVLRRSRHDLAEAKARLEVVEGLGLASVEIDRVIEIIRSSKDPEEARTRLTEHEFTGLGEFLRRAGRPESEIEAARQKGPYHLSERQAQAILDMRLHRLTGLQQDKLASEYGSLCTVIEELTRILSDEDRLNEVIVEELDAILEEYADERRTEIVERTGEITEEDVVADEDMVVTMTVSGYIKRTPLSEFRAQHRGGKGRTGAAVRAEDQIAHMFVGTALSHVLLFTNSGRVFSKRVYQIPERAPASQGKAMINFVDLQDGEQVVAMLPIRDFEDGAYVVFATERGIVKKTELSAFDSIRSTGIIAAVLDEGDSIIEVRVTDGERHILLATAMGQAIRFPENQIRPMGRVSRGVKGITLRPGDRVISMTTVEAASAGLILTVTERGFGKLTHLSEYPLRNRGGIGVLTARINEKSGRVVSLRTVSLEDHVMLITTRGRVIRIPVSSISQLGRVTTGVTLVRGEPDESVMMVARISVEEDSEDDPEKPAEQGADQSEPPQDTDQETETRERDEQTNEQEEDHGENQASRPEHPED